MKRFVIAIITAFLLTLTCFSQSPIDELAEQFNLSALYQSIPQETVPMIEEMKLFDMGAGEILSLTPTQLFKMIKNEALNAILSYKSTLLSVAAAVLLCAILSSFGEGTKAASVFGFICALSITAVLTYPVLQCLLSGCEAIRSASLFMLSYIPVYTAVLASGGAISGAAVYQMFVLPVCQILSQLSAAVFLPVLQAYMLLVISGSIGSNNGIIALASAVKKALNWALLLIATAFTGLLSLQGFLSGAADSAGAKAAKFLVGSFVPVVGGALSDAMTAVYSGLHVIKAGVGVFGIVIAALTLLPVLVNITVLRGVIWISKLASETLDAKKAEGVLSGFSNVLSALTALLLCVITLLVVSTAVMMSLCGGLAK